MISTYKMNTRILSRNEQQQLHMNRFNNNVVKAIPVLPLRIRKCSSREMNNLRFDAFKTSLFPQGKTSNKEKAAVVVIAVAQTNRRYHNFPLKSCNLKRRFPNCSLKINHSQLKTFHSNLNCTNLTTHSSASIRKHLFFFFTSKTTTE